MRKPLDNSTRTPGQFSAPVSIDELALQSARHAIDMTALGGSCIDELSALFTAIVSLGADSEAIRKLAKIGIELADQHYETFELNNNSAKGHLAAIRAAAGGSHA